MSAAETEADAVFVDRVGVSASPAEARLEDQIASYDAKSQHNQRWFKLLKVCQIIAAAAIPVAAGASAPAWLVGGAGALIVVLEGLQQLQQCQQNWITYRSTCERLKLERQLRARSTTGRARGQPRLAGARRLGVPAGGGGPPCGE